MFVPVQIMLQLEGIVLNVVGVVLHRQMIGEYMQRVCSALSVKVRLSIHLTQRLEMLQHALVSVLLLQAHLL